MFAVNSYVSPLSIAYCLVQTLQMVKKEDNTRRIKNEYMFKLIIWSITERSFVSGWVLKYFGLTFFLLLIKDIQIQTFSKAHAA